MRFVLVRSCLLLAVALAGTGCLSAFDSGAQSADMAVAAADLSSAGAVAVYYDPDIQHDLDTLGCTVSACHGSTASPLISAMPTALSDWLSNYNDIHADCTTLDCLGGGASSLLLTKPLQGSVAHVGTKPFASTEDPTYQRWLAWLEAGAPFSASPPDMATIADLATAPSSDMKPGETLTVTFTTSMSPSAGTSPFDPKNVVAVWIESNGTFVKTVGRWANTRRTKLVGWVAKAGSADVDAVSGATNANYGTLTARWDMSARQLPAPPLPAPVDGTYTIRMELADSNASAPTQNNQGMFTFNRNGIASSQAGQSSGGFSNVSIVYSGR